MSRPRVLLLHPILEPGSRLLIEACDVVAFPEDLPPSEAAIIAHGRGCQAIVSQMMDPIGDGVLGLPGLRIVANVGAHYANIDLDAARRHRVMVTNTPDDSTQSVADFTFGLMIAAARRILEADRFARAGRFRGWRLDGFLGEDLHEATLGIIGWDRVSQAIAERAGGFHMQVLYHDPLDAGGVGAQDATADGGAVGLDELLAASDFVCVCAAARSARTRHLIAARQLRAMKSTAVLVNTAQGVVDEGALVDALRTGTIFAAAVDVYEDEPVIHPGLIELPNVVLGAHCHSASRRLRTQRSLVAAQDVIAAVSGRRPRNLVNAEVFD